MLQQLTISNFATIESFDLEFDHGFSVITGETGAGKSIMIGGIVAEMVLIRRVTANYIDAGQ